MKLPDFNSPLHTHECSCPIGDCPDCPICMAEAERKEKAMTWPERRTRARHLLKHRFPDVAHSMLCRWLKELSERLDAAAWDVALTPTQVLQICATASVDLAIAAEAATPNGGPNSR